ncbi:FAD-binding protein [Roseibium salinum]|nr:FAD-binding protein [Roseibium salinum]
MASNGQYRSWGLPPKAGPQRILQMQWQGDSLPESGRPYLAFGNGRSYGDSCLNGQGTLVNLRGLDRFISFDGDTGVLRCEAGVLLSDILTHFVPRGWFLPVTPGTRYVTVGGCHCQRRSRQEPSSGRQFRTPCAQPGTAALGWLAPCVLAAGKTRSGSRRRLAAAD